MDWEVAYWQDDNLTIITSEDMGWEDLPEEGVLWVEVGNQRLQGMDRYWLHEPSGSFGAFIVDYDQYDHNGPYEASYGPGGEGYVHILKGAWVPDEVAQELGIA